MSHDYPALKLRGIPFQLKVSKCQNEMAMCHNETQCKKKKKKIPHSDHIGVDSHRKNISEQNKATVVNIFVF